MIVQQLKQLSKMHNHLVGDLLGCLLFEFERLFYYVRDLRKEGKHTYESGNWYKESSENKCGADGF